MRNVSFGICGFALGMAAILGFGLDAAHSAHHEKFGSRMGFEAKTSGCSPEAWKVRTEGYASEVITWDAASGQQSLRLHQVSADQAVSGEVAQEVAVDQIAGKRLHLDAKLKCITAPGAKIWIQIDRLSGDSDNKESAEIKVGGWKSVSLAAEIPSDAKTVTIGVRTPEGGDVLIDEIDARCES